MAWSSPHSLFFLLIAACVGIPSLSVGQTCGTQPPSEAQYAFTRDVVSHITIEALRNGGTTCVPLQTHVVRMADGTGGLSIGDLNDALTFLNVFYLEAGIEFYWKDFPNTVDNDDYFEFNQAAPDGDTENDLAGLFPTATDAVNIYFVNNIFLWDGSNAGGYAYYPADAAYSNRIVMTHYYTLYSPNGTFVHELGPISTYPHSSGNREWSRKHKC